MQTFTYVKQKNMIIAKMNTINKNIIKEKHLQYKDKVCHKNRTESLNRNISRSMKIQVTMQQIQMSCIRERSCWDALLEEEREVEVSMRYHINIADWQDWNEWYHLFSAGMKAKSNSPTLLVKMRIVKKKNLRKPSGNLYKN